jgi:hypothetical protein
MNHYPSTALPDGKTPRQLLLEFLKTPNPVPSVYGIRKFRQPRWVHIPKQRRITGDKFSPRARKAYMVGSDGSRIFYMWDPETNKVSRTSSVAWAKHGLIEAPSARTISAPPDTAFQITIPLSTIDSPPLQLPKHAPMQRELLQPYLGGARVRASNEDYIPELGQGHSFNGFEEQSKDNKESISSKPHASAPTQAPIEAPRHLDIAADQDDRLILQATRMRKPSAKAAGLATAICLQNHTVPLFVARCFATSMIDAPSATKDNPNLLPKLVSAKQARIHRFSKR